MPIIDVNRRLIELKARQARLREQYTIYHPVICYPGWIVQNLSPDARGALTKNPQKILHISDLHTEIRAVKRNGVEMRLIPRPHGLRLKWMYHLPRILADGRDTCVPLSQWTAGQRIGIAPNELDRTIPWKLLGPDDTASAHDIIEFQAMISKIPAQSAEMNTRYLPIDCVHGALIRLPHCDLTVSMAINQAITLNRSDHTDDRISYRVLNPNTLNISYLPHSCIAAAAKRLSRECAERSWLDRARTNIPNAWAIAKEMASDAAGFVSRLLKPNPNKEKST